MKSWQMHEAQMIATLPPSVDKKGSKASVVFIGVVLLSAPLGVMMSVGYHALFALEAWALNSPYPPEELEFLQPGKIIELILGTYLLCAVPILVTATALAWRTWRQGSVSYIYAAVISGVAMAVYMGGLAYIFRHELVSVVTQETAINGIVYAVIVNTIITALLRLRSQIVPPK